MSSNVLVIYEKGLEMFKQVVLHSKHQNQATLEVPKLVARPTNG
jgi:hypothetical protein